MQAIPEAMKKPSLTSVSLLLKQRVVISLIITCVVSLAAYAIMSAGSRHTQLHSSSTAFVTFTPNAARLSTPAIQHGAMNTPEGNSQHGFPAAAKENLAEFQDKLLSIGIPFFGVDQAFEGKDNAPSLWNLLRPIISCPPVRPVTRYGSEGDGGKLLCLLPQQWQGPACVIYSLGSNGDYDFELNVLNQTSCTVHTFDCTYDGKSQGPRHRYHKWCVGDEKSGKDFKSWANITESLGHRRIDVLKIDVEGHEYKVFSDMHAKGANLPEQIVAEFHFNADNINHPEAHTGAEVVLTFAHLAHLGYAEYAQELNPLFPWCCAEVSFYKVA